MHQQYLYDIGMPYKAVLKDFAYFSKDCKGLDIVKFVEKYESIHLNRLRKLEYNAIMSESKDDLYDDFREK